MTKISTESPETPRPWITGIVLAAGRGARLGGETPKPLVRVDGERLVHRACCALLEAGVEQVLVVVGYRGDEVARALHDLPVETVTNGGWAEGLSTSVAVGLAHADGVANAALLMPADQPRLTAEHLREMVALYREKQPRIVAAADSTGEVRGAPALFDRRCFAELNSLEGDRGARQLVRDAGTERLVVRFDSDTLLDIDTQADLDRLRG